MTAYRRLLQDTLPGVQSRVREAAERVGRDPEEVRIVTVTKGHPLEAIEAALELGLQDLGENRLAELEAKAAKVPPESARWHMIGRLQRRSAPAVRGVVSLVHSIDSLRLAERLERTASPGSARLPVLVQVNTSLEASKTGFAPRDLVSVLEQLIGFETLSIEGLMTMAPFTSEEAVLRSTFRELRELQDTATSRLPAYRGKELSMGMSNDFELAVEEGSTIVRIGSALLGERTE